MKREEAKQLLELCRPGMDEGQHDPALAEAYAMLESDAELKAWFEETQQLDARISEHLNSIEAPADLQDTILAGMRLHQTNSAHSQPADSRTVPFPTTSPEQSRAWWLSPWSGIAALFAIMMIIFVLPEDGPAESQMADADLPPVLQFLSQEIDSLKSWQFEKKGQDPTELQAFLASANAPSPSSIPSSLSNMPSIGCVTFEYGEDAKLSMICFKNGEVYHLITADKATYPDNIPSEPTLYQCEDKAFRLWSDENQVKILTIHGSKEDMPEFI